MIITQEIFDYLAKARQTLSLAESCTGGGLAHEITSIAGSSQVFLGGVVAYTNPAKEKLLHIPSEILQEHGAVSEIVAQMMAENCRKLFSSTWAIATTGNSGPTGTPLGLVYISVSGPSLTLIRSFTFKNATRLSHRQKTIEQALMLFKEQLI